MRRSSLSLHDGACVLLDLRPRAQLFRLNSFLRIERIARRNENSASRTGGIDLFVGGGLFLRWGWPIQHSLDDAGGPENHDAHGSQGDK
jgi:hypothetical protein